MKRAVCLMAILSLHAPLPLRAAEAADVVVTSSGGSGAAALAVAGGTARLVLADALPETATAHLAPLAARAGRPPPRPVIVVALPCAWPDPPAAMDALRRGFAASPVWFVLPAPGGCNADEIRAAFDQAAASDERERLSLLITAGLRLAGPPDEDAASLPAATVMISDGSGAPGAGPTPSAGTGIAPDRAGIAAGGGGALTGGPLVISSLPAGMSLNGGAGMVIRAEEAITAAPAAIAADPVTPADPAPQAATVPALPATPRRAGLPEPAIILGELASLLGADKRGPMGVPRDIRDRIRQIDPALFDRILADGGFDPAQNQYNAAIQTELAAMNCYSGGIDGDWGSGSLAALGRYFSVVGAAQAAEAPGPELYRQMASLGPVTCPEVRVSTPRNPAPGPAATPRAGGGSGATAGRNSGGGGGGGNTANRPRTPAPATQPAAPQTQRPTAQTPSTTAPSAPRINPNLAGGVGSGVIK
ncbi:MAG: hypothetical protein Q4G25_07395 [Paracoccus sp. (in: a-proteobacteria)]|nr:hypothetical protein [Paracoccus sp. (in: a-proteobacteria)]